MKMYLKVCLVLLIFCSVGFGSKNVAYALWPYSQASYGNYSQGSYFSDAISDFFDAISDAFDGDDGDDGSDHGHPPPGTGGDENDVVNEFTSNCNAGCDYRDVNGNGLPDPGEPMDSGNGSDGSSDGTPGGPSQGSYTNPCPINSSAPCNPTHYSQSTYYSQSAYEDTPTVTDPSTDPAVSLYIQKQGTTGWSKNMVGSPSDEVTLRWVVARANYCQSTDTTLYSLTDTTGVSGSTNNVEEPSTGQRVYRIECRNAAGTTARSSASLTVSATPITFTANPKIVRTGENSTLTWNVYGRTGCTTAKKSNGTDSSTDIPSSGSRDTEPLLGETTYRLSCPDGAQAEATIKVLPIYSET